MVTQLELKNSATDALALTKFMNEPAGTENLNSGRDDIGTLADVKADASLDLISSRFGFSIPASVFGIVSSPTLDQTQKFQEAVDYCSPRNFSIDINGLEVRFGKQSNTDDKYNDVRNPANVPSDTSSTVRTYAIRIPTGGFMGVVGKGTIGNLNPNDDQYCFHSEDDVVVRCGDDVTWDGHHEEQGWGGVFHLMGFSKIFLGSTTFYRDGICRLGASPNKPGGAIYFDNPYWFDCWGTHCIGGKPGGFSEIWGNSMKFINTRGALNLETEDVNGFNDDGDGGTLWTPRITGRVSAVYTDGVDGDKDPARPVQATAVTFSEASFGFVRVDLIVARNHTASTTGNAGAVVVGGGQTNLPYSVASIGHIHGINILQAVRYDATQSGGERISVEKITGNNIEQIVKARKSDSASGAPEGARSLSIGEIRVNEVTEAFSVFNEDQDGDLIEEFSVGIARIETCINSAGYFRDIKRLTIDDYSWGDVRQFRSGAAYGSYAMWVDTGDFKVKSCLRSEDSHNQFLRIEADTFDVSGLDQVTADAGGGITLAGSGEGTIRNSKIRATGGGDAIRDDGNWSGEVDLINVDINGNGLDPQVIPRKVRNSDILKATLTNWNPGEVVKNRPSTTTVTIPAAKSGDSFTVRPTTITNHQEHLSYKAYFSATGTVRVAVRNFGSERLNDDDPGNSFWEEFNPNPGSATYEIIGERG